MAGTGTQMWWPQGLSSCVGDGRTGGLVRVDAQPGFARSGTTALPP